MAQPPTSTAPTAPTGRRVRTDETDHPLEEPTRGRPRPDRGPRRRLPARRGPAAAAAAPGGGVRTARRARLGAPRSPRPSADDAEFRERVATQATARATSTPRPRPRATASRWRWPRSPGWSARRGGDAARRRRRPSGTARPGRDSAEVERLAGRLADAEQALRDLRARHREQVEEHKAENASLRRKLGESRRAPRGTRARPRRRCGRRRSCGPSPRRLAAGQEKELRRLRAQVAQPEARGPAAATGAPRARSATR